jgi:hypothetical protein
MASSAGACRQGLRLLHRRGPGTLDRKGFLGARPGRHGDRDEGERGLRLGLKLEMRAERDRQANAGRQVDDALLCTRAPPHPATPGQNIPDLLDAAVGDGVGDCAGRQFEMREAAAREREEQTHRGSIGRDSVGVFAGDLGLEGAHDRVFRGFGALSLPRDAPAAQLAMEAPIKFLRPAARLL